MLPVWSLQKVCRPRAMADVSGRAVRKASAAQIFFVLSIPSPFDRAATAGFLGNGQVCVEFYANSKWSNLGDSGPNFPGLCGVSPVVRVLRRLCFLDPDDPRRAARSGAAAGHARESGETGVGIR